MAGKEHSRSDKELDVVIALFPYHELSIRRLIKINASFQELCVDFLEARSALRLASEATDGTPEKQRTEWIELIDRLHAELSDAIRAYETTLPTARR